MAKRDAVVVTNQNIGMVYGRILKTARKVLFADPVASQERPMDFLKLTESRVYCEEYTGNLIVSMDFDDARTGECAYNLHFGCGARVTFLGGHSFSVEWRVARADLGHRRAKWLFRYQIMPRRAKSAGYEGQAEAMGAFLRQQSNDEEELVLRPGRTP